MTKSEKQWLGTYLNDKEKELRNCYNYYKEHNDKTSEEIKQQLYLFYNMKDDLQRLLNQ